MLRARVLLASGDKDAALAMLEQVQAQIAKHGGVMPASFLAGFYAGAGRTDLALSSADTALQDDPTDWRVLSLRARLHLAAGRPEAAIADAAASLGLVYFNCHTCTAGSGSDPAGPARSRGPGVARRHHPGARADGCA